MYVSSRCLSVYVYVWGLGLCRHFPVNVDAQPSSSLPSLNPLGLVQEKHACIYRMQYTGETCGVSGLELLYAQCQVHSVNQMGV